MGLLDRQRRRLPCAATEPIRLRSTLAYALSVEDVNDLRRATGQAERLRTVRPHPPSLAIASTLARAKVEPLAGLFRAFNYQDGVQVAYTAFDNRLARMGSRRSCAIGGPANPVALAV